MLRRKSGVPVRLVRAEKRQYARLLCTGILGTLVLLALALTSSVKVSSSTSDPTPANNSDSSVATVGPSAQTIASVSDSVPPVGHSYIIGMVVQDSKVLLATVLEAYESQLYAGTSLFFTKVFDVMDVNIVVDEGSPVAVFPQDPNRVYYVGGLIDLRLWTYRRNPP